MDTNWIAFKNSPYGKSTLRKIRETKLEIRKMEEAGKTQGEVAYLRFRLADLESRLRGLYDNDGDLT